MIEKKLAQALDHAAPDDFEAVFSRCEKGVPMKQTTKKSKRWVAVLIAACMALALLGTGGGLFYRQNYAVASVISIDVNPSIELQINRGEEVLSCKALNDDAAVVLADMEGGKALEGVDLEVAVNAIVGSLVRGGYLDDISSAILISVEDDDAERGARLRENLVATVDGMLNTGGTHTFILDQSVKADDALKEQAQEHHISTGKAMLVQQVIAQNGSLEFDKLAALSVEELRDMTETGSPAMPIGKDAAARAAKEYAGVADDPSVIAEVDPELDETPACYEVELFHPSHGEFEYRVDAFSGKVLSGTPDIANASGSDVPVTPTISQDEAKQIALSHAGVTESQTTNLTVKREVDDGRLEYEVEFRANGYEYEYTIDGATGAILKHESEPIRNASTPSTGETTPSTPSTPSAADIGRDAAKAVALNHAGVTESQTTNLTVKRDYDDGRLEYEIDFIANGYEYEYTVDGATGAILDHDAEVHRTGGNQSSGGGSQSSGTTDIGRDAAKTAALNHAGVTESQTTNLTVKRDYDDGRLEYEVEFRANGYEYEYKIDGATGAVLKYESEPLHSTSTPSTGGTTPSTPSATDIGRDAAKAAALNHAGVTESQTTNLTVKRDYDDGRLEYEVEFRANGYEYEYKIDGATGAVLKYESEPLHSTSTPSTGETTPSTPSATDIGRDAAKAAALNHAGVTESQTTNLTVKRDYDDGRLEYEVEFRANGYEYEYKIDGATGAVLKHESEPLHSTSTPSTGETTPSTPSATDIGEAAAKAAALNHAGLTEAQVSGLIIKRDYDDGRLEYEVEFRANGYEYEYKIDGETGTVLEWERDD